MDFEEKTVSSREIFQGKIVKLRVDTVVLPDSRQSTREVVEHAGAVAIVALDENRNIIMVRQYRKPVEEVLLEIPAGTLEANEDPLVCAQRELQEETGFTAEHWQKILAYYSAPGFCNERLHLYLASGLHPGEGHTDDDEFIEMVRIPLQDAYQLIFTGKIQDGKSIIGLQYACRQA
jgi:ADP-ribose pyrophosphatase